MAPQAAGVVHDRREEIDCGHQGTFRGQQKHRGVVAGGGVDQDPRVPDCGQMAQDLRQIGGAELTGSTRAVRERGETNPWLLIPRRLCHTRSREWMEPAV